MTIRELTDKELDAVAAGLAINPPGGDHPDIIFKREFPKGVPDTVPPIRIKPE